MSTMPCPVCGEPIEFDKDRDASAPVNCQECGAMLSTDAIEQAAAQVAARAAEDEAEALPVEPEMKPDRAEELLQAFKDQFERHEVRLPREWIDRLRKLATETEASRRQATIFFVDLRGYTRLSQVLDDVQLDRLRQWFYEICTRRVELHGGFIIQFLGDAAYAAFGAPWAFERDSESALRALLDIRDEIRRKGGFEGHELAIRAGAASGTVNVRLTEEHGRARPDLFGSPVNLAARLEAQSDTWEILISDTLADQVSGVFELEPRAAWTPKNYNREVQPYAVIKHKGEEAVRRPINVRFIGRKQEILDVSHWTLKSIGGEFTAARLTGEAGTGKTRLMNEIMSTADSADMWEKVGCEPHDRHILLGGILKLTAKLAMRLAKAEGIAPPRSHDETFEIISRCLGEKLGVALPSIGYVLGVEPHATRLKGLPAKELKAQVVASMVAMITAAASATPPLLLFFDDAQWFDRLSWEVIVELVRQRPRNVLVITSGRLQAAEGDTDADAESLDEFTKNTAGAEWEKLNLAALPEDERIELVGEILDIGNLHPLLRSRLIEESEGIPLYMIELARDVAEHPEQSLAKLVEVRKGEALGVSGAIVDILQARLDKLNRQKRALLQCGAVLGRRFDTTVVRVFEQIHADLLGELYALKGLHLLQDEPLPEDIAFFFTPTVLRDVAYRMLTPEQRVQLHKTVAQQIERRFADNLKQFAYELAIHWIRAGEISKARPHLRRAAQRAMDQGLPHEAYELIRLALDPPPMPGVTPKTNEAQANDPIFLQQTGLVREMGGKACRLMGDYAKADEHFKALGEIADKINNDLWRATAHFQMAINNIERGDMEQAEKEVQLALSIPTSGPEVSARCRNAKGIIRLRTGKVQEALEEFLSLAEDLKSSDRLHLTCADAWNNAGLAYWYQGKMEQCRDAFLNALDTWQKAGNLCGQVSTLSNLGIAAEKLGRFEEAEKHYSEASKIAEQIGYLHGISAVEANRANLSLLRRNWNAAQRQSARSLRAARLIGHKNSEAIALENLGLALSGMGQLDHAYGMFKEAGGIGESTADPLRRDSALLASAWSAMMNGEFSRAREDLKRVSGESSQDLALWKETLRMTLDALDSRPEEAAKLASTLDELQKSGTLEDYLRRVDAAILLSDRGLMEESVGDDLARRRREAMGLEAVA